MTPDEIFAEMSPAMAERIYGWMSDSEKPLYKAAIESLAKKRNLRPVFVQRKPRPERHAWMQEAMGRKTGGPVAAQILQIWLVGAESKLLCDFLDALGIKHDEDGTVEDLPGEPPREELEAAVTRLLETHEPEVVSVYLWAFQALNETGWGTLDALLAGDERLRLG